MSQTEAPPSPPSKSADNERRKLLANSLNTIGLAAFGLGVLTPAFTQPGDLGLFRVVGSLAILVAFHLAAQYLLRRLKD